MSEQASLFRRFIMGAGYLDGYGHHPGTELLVGLCLITGIGGAQTGGITGFAFGMGISAIVYGPLWIYGCIDRANCYLRYVQRQPRQQEQST